MRLMKQKHLDDNCVFPPMFPCFLLVCIHFVFVPDMSMASSLSCDTGTYAFHLLINRAVYLPSLRSSNCQIAFVNLIIILVL